MARGNMKVRLDSAGMAAMLASSEVGAAISGLGDTVAGNAQGETAGDEPIPVHVRSRTAQGGRLSPRPAADVILAHPAGIRVNAKRGTLYRAAAAAGLEVKERPTA